MSLPGMRGASALGASTLGISALGPSALGASPCPGARSGDSIVSDAEAAFGSLEASEEGGTAGPAPREPVSPLLGSACCSLTSILPVKVDYLVTYIAYELVTGGGLTKILGSHRGKF